MGIKWKSYLDVEYLGIMIDDKLDFKEHNKVIT